MTARIQHSSLSLDVLEESPRVNVRAGLNEHAIEDYADAYRNGTEMPPVIVFCEKGCERYLLVDGRHRKAAAESAGLKKLEVEVHEGDETDALRFALSLNCEHGVRRSPNDLKIAMNLLLQNERLCGEYKTAPDKAKLLHCSQRQVQRLVAEWRATKAGGAGERSQQRAAARRAAKYTPPARVPVNGGESPDDEINNFVSALDVIATAKVDPKKLANSGMVTAKVVHKAADRIWIMVQELQ